MLLGLTLVAGGAGGGWWIYEGAGDRRAPDGIVAASGRIEVERVHLAPATEGRVLRLAVAEGEAVDAGDLVAEIDARVPEAAVAEAEAAVAAARASRAVGQGRLEALQSELALARTEAGRVVRLYDDGAVSRQELDRAETAVERLSAAVRSAEAALEATERQLHAARARREAASVRLTETRLAAPVDGRVDMVLTREGEMASPGRPVVTLLRNGTAKLRIYLPLREAERIGPGAEARVYLDGFPESFFDGRVDWVAADAEFTPRDVHVPDERTTLVFAADVRVVDPDGRLKDGFPADVWLRLDHSAPWPDDPPW
jgi:HlyD family secretion protein